MNYGLAFVNTLAAVDPEGCAEVGRVAEELGFDSVWTVEHVLVPSGYQSTYPYDDSGKMPGGEVIPIPDPLIWLAYLAANTSTVRLCTGILILPQRNPGVLAKEVATLDHLSGGRVTLGIGVGWLEEEFDALGVPFDERAAITDDYVAALRAMWTTEKTTYTSDYVQWDEVVSLPKPAQGSVPIVVGGHTKASARRAGRLGDGYFPGKGDIEMLIGEVRTAAEEAGRDPEAIEITYGSQDVLIKGADEVKRLEEIGVDRVVLPSLAFDVPSIRANLEGFADKIMV